MSQKKRRPIPFNKPYLTGNELRYIGQAHINGNLAGGGIFTKKCHAWLEKQIGCCKAFLTHSGTAALEMAAILAGIQPGDEVIMPSYTFVSTANAFVLRGAVPVFLDIRSDTLNMDEALIGAAITPRTKAIVPVHYAGISCEMDAIMEIARRHRLMVIEDAAQALLSTYKGKPLGSIGPLGVVSFHETKNIISGEGGALLVNDPELINRAEIIWEKGTNRDLFLRGQADRYTWCDIGSSFFPGELVAAFLYAQFEKAKKIITVRKCIFKHYMESLKPAADKGAIRLPFVLDECACNGHIFYIVTKSPERRAKLMAYLKARGIHAALHYLPLHSSPAGIKYGKTGSAMAVTDDLSTRVLRLPFYYEMTDNDVDRVAQAINDWAQRCSA